jgi:hypothetical protein
LITVGSLELNTVLVLVSLENLDCHVNWGLLFRKNFSLDLVLVLGALCSVTLLFEVSEDLLKNGVWAFSCKEFSVLVDKSNVFFELAL